ncbi:hypothetical protein GCM10010965_14970 [Caldalkalibacillus thermarum]|nr:hypothetical protein GCM10010965_14970 [Caldalkalibacillus thermarum]
MEIHSKILIDGMGEDHHIMMGVGMEADMEQGAEAPAEAELRIFAGEAQLMTIE